MTHHHPLSVVDVVDEVLEVDGLEVDVCDGVAAVEEDDVVAVARHDLPLPRGGVGGRQELQGEGQGLSEQREGGCGKCPYCTIYCFNCSNLVGSERILLKDFHSIIRAYHVLM